MDICIGAKIYIRKIDKYLFSILLGLLFLGIVPIIYHESLSFLRIKTALGSIVMLLLFIGIIFVYSHRYGNKKLLETIVRYYYFFSFIQFICLLIILIVYGPGKHRTLRNETISFCELTLISPLYVYGYTLSKCLINRRWRLHDILLLGATTVVSFCFLYRSTWIMWITITMFILFINLKDTKKAIQPTIVVSLLLLFGFIGTNFVAPTFMKSIFGQTSNEIGAISELRGADINYLKTNVTEVSNRWGSTRLFLWTEAIPYIKARPLLGNGIGFENYLGVSGEITTVYSMAIHPVATFHSQLIGLVVDFGLIGATLFYLVIIKTASLGFHALRKFDISREKKQSIYCFFVVFIMYLLGSIIGGNIIPSHTGIYAVLPFWLFIAAIILEYKKLRQSYGGMS